MELELLNTSVVVLADAHNPSILHPSFLSSQQIVPERWETAEPPLCTPALSVVKYRNGISFTVESSKLLVQNSQPPPNSRDDAVARLATKYVEVLPHVRYVAVGLNFTGFLETPSPDAALISRFLAAGPWNASPLELDSTGIRLIYKVLEGVLRLSCDPGKMTRIDRPEEKVGIIVQGNYHYQLSARPSSGSVRDAIARYPSCFSHFGEVVQSIFSLVTAES